MTRTGLRPDAIAEVAEHQPAERAGDEAHAEGREGEQRSDGRIGLREEDLAEHQRGGGAVDEEVVPLQRRADRRRYQYPAMRCVHSLSPDESTVRGGRFV